MVDSTLIRFIYFNESGREYFEYSAIGFVIIINSITH